MSSLGQAFPFSYLRPLPAPDTFPLETDPDLSKHSASPSSQNNPCSILFLALFASLLRWGSVSPLSFLATSPRAVYLCASHSPYLHFSFFFSMQGWILPLPLCEYSPYEAQEQSCNHVTYSSCWLLCSSWDSLLPCFSVSLAPSGVIFVSLLLLVSLSSSLNPLKYFLGFCSYVVFLTPHISSVFTVLTTLLMCQRLLNLCLPFLSLRLIPASRTEAGSGQKVLYSISFNPHNSPWGMSRYHSTCISYLRKLCLKDVQEHIQSLMSSVLARQTYLDILQASPSQHCPQLNSHYPNLLLCPFSHQNSLTIIQLPMNRCGIFSLSSPLSSFQSIAKFCWIGLLNMSWVSFSFPSGPHSFRPYSYGLLQ